MGVLSPLAAHQPVVELRPLGAEGRRPAVAHVDRRNDGVGVGVASIEAPNT